MEPRSVSYAISILSFGMSALRTTETFIQKSYFCILGHLFLNTLTPQSDSEIDNSISVPSGTYYLATRSIIPIVCSAIALKYLEKTAYSFLKHSITHNIAGIILGKYFTEKTLGTPLSWRYVVGMEFFRPKKW